MRAIESRNSPLPPELCKVLTRWRRDLQRDESTPSRKLRRRLDDLLEPDRLHDNPFTPGDPWGDRSRDWFDSLADEEKAWTGLLDHAITGMGKARPSARWERTAATLLDELGPDRFAPKLIEWLDTIDLKHERGRKWDPQYGLMPANADLLRSLIWFARFSSDDALAAALGRFALRAYRKISGFGAASAKLGNAAVASLGAMADARGVVHLTRLATQVRYASARTQIERAIATAGERSGHSREDIEEIAVPRFGLDDAGRRVHAMGDFQVELAVTGSSAVLGWIKANGKRQKTVPKAVKEADPDGVKALRAELKNIKTVLAAQSDRIEQHYLTGRSLPLEQLRERYLEHPVVGLVARRLLWWLTPEGSSPIAGLWQDGALSDLGGNPIDLPSDTPSRLWHPLHGGLEDQLVWRDRLEELGLEQPFSQVWREVYRASDEAGAPVSNRFSGVLLIQRRLLDYAQRRGWRYRIQGYFDSWNAPTLQVGDLVVELSADPVAHNRDDYLYDYVLTGVLRVLDERGPIDLDQVEPILLSEILRRADRLVSAASAGATAPTRGFPRHFDWEDLAFGPLTALGRTRLAVLERVLPRLQIHPSCHLDDPWLVVDGPQGRAHIHLGSGQVQVDGTARSIQPDRKAVSAAKRAFLPFEGDGALPGILAVAHSWQRGG